MNSSMGTNSTPDRLTSGMMTGELELMLHDMDLDDTQDDELDVGTPIECPCCGLADAMAGEYEICPRCSWEHCTGDESSPWLGSAFSGPNHADLGTHRLRVWRWLLNPENEPPRMSLVGLADAEELEKALVVRILAQGPRPAMPNLALSGDEVRWLDKVFRVSPIEDETHCLYWSLNSMPQLGGDLLHEVAGKKVLADRKPWQHACFTEVMALVAKEWATSSHGSFHVRWQRVLIVASLACAGEIPRQVPMEAVKILGAALRRHLSSIRFVKDEEEFRRHEELMGFLELAVQESPQGFFASALYGIDY